MGGLETCQASPAGLHDPQRPRHWHVPAVAGADMPFVATIVLGVALGVVLTVLAAAVGVPIMQQILGRPHDPTFRTFNNVHNMPYPLFWMAGAYNRAVELFVQSKPAPLRVAEVAMTYIQSQVLFTLVQLDLPRYLRAGPKSALKLAAELGPHVHPDWLERVLAAGYVYGLVGRVKAPRRSLHGVTPHAAPTGMVKTASGSSISCSGNDSGSEGEDTTCVKDQQRSGQAAAQTKGGAAARPTTGAASISPWLYQLNATTSVLCEDHPACMANFVRLMRHHYQPFGYLAEGVASSRAPFDMCTGGGYWEYNLQHPDHTAIFDQAMMEVNELGGLSVQFTYPWARFAAVVDVAGGTGGFVASMLKHNPQLRTWVLDRAEQVAAGAKIWEQRHPELLQRNTFVAGDMFNPGTIPSPAELQLAAPQPQVAYTLRNILHDWGDEESLAILSSIRARISTEEAASGRVKLVIVESTTFDQPLGAATHRHATDVMMLMCYGDGQERNRAQFEALLGATGWRLTRVMPTCSIMVIPGSTPCVSWGIRNCRQAPESQLHTHYCFVCWWLHHDFCACWESVLGCCIRAAGLTNR